MMESVVLLVICVVTLQLCGADDCLTPPPSSGTLTLTSRRNLTGHWNLEVRLEHLASSDHDDRNAGPWQVVVDHGSKRCDRGEMVFAQVSLTAPVLKPGPDYEHFPGEGYFKYHTTTETWLDAKKTCNQEGAHLAVINSERESQYMVQVLAQYKSNVAFIGFHDRFVEGEFLTVLGTPLNTTGFTRWADKRLPDNGGNIPEPGADCGGIYINGGLHDLKCQNKLPFFCEAPE